jgi:hypothetical protein
VTAEFALRHLLISGQCFERAKKGGMGNMTSF